MAHRAHTSLGRGKRLRFGALVAVASLLLAACSSSSVSSPSTTAAKTPYVFHAVLSLTGSASILGTRERKSLESFAADINAHGGIHGRPIKMDIKDNGSNPSTAVSVATPWVSKGVPFILNGSVVATDKAVDALATSSGPVIYDLSPGVHPAASSYVWSAGISTRFDAAAYLNFFKGKGLTRIAALTSTDASGTDGLRQLKAALARPAYSGLHLVANQTFDITAPTVTTQLSVIKAAKPQALVVWTTGPQVGTVFKGMSALGMSSIPTVTTDGDAFPSLLKHFSSVLPSHLYFPTGALFLPPSSLSGGVKTAVSAFDSDISKYGGHPNDGWGLSYVAAEVITKALKSIGPSATASQIRHYLQTKIKSFPSIYGVMNMSSSNHRGLDVGDIYITEWNGSSFVAKSGPGGTGS